MTRLSHWTTTACLVVALFAFGTVSWGQEALTARLHPSGMIQVARGTAELAMIELNAHGLQWKHSPQAGATAQTSDLPDRQGKRVVGTLPIPGAADAALRFVQTVRPTAQGLLLEYDISVTKALRLNGLQLSICLPSGLFAGKELMIGQIGPMPRIISLPAADSKPGSQLWSGEGERVEVGRGTPETLVAQLRAPTDIMVQDLRQWEHQTFEIRLPAIMEDGGRDLTTEDRFHLDLTVSFGAAITLAGP